MPNTGISDLQIGDHARVIGFRPGDKPYRHKMLSMGLTPKTEFQIVRAAPLGDPVELKVRGFSLSLRKNEAHNLIIEKI